MSLAIPIPTIIGQKAWREERMTNINAAIKALVAAINAERDKQNEDVRKSVNKTYTYYMQNLNKQIEENRLLRAENDTLKTENNKVKQRISQLDEKAVERVTTSLLLLTTCHAVQTHTFRSVAQMVVPTS